jgi:hypothetical protein
VLLEVTRQNEIQIANQKQRRKNVDDNPEGREPNDKQTQPTYYDRREERWRRRAERRAARGLGYGGWLLGAILVLAGVLLLLESLGLLSTTNWWALFILLPAAGAFARAQRHYQLGGGFTRGVRASLISGVFLVVLTVLFLVNVNWLIAGPVVLILGGLVLLLNAISPA